MPLYMTTFERVNFTFSKLIKQSIDIVFECDVEDEEGDNWNKLHQAACDIFAEQVGDSFSKPSVGLMKKINTNWSSTTGGMRFERIEIPYADREIEQPTQEKPTIACRFTINGEKPFGGRVHSYRATGFYRMEELPPRIPVENPITNDEIASSIIDEILIEDDEERGLTGIPRYRVIKCLPEDATIISGSGVSGVIIPIKDITVDGLVDWSETKIKQEQGKYAARVAKYTKDDITDDNFQLGREWRIRMAEKLGMR